MKKAMAIALIPFLLALLFVSCGSTKPISLKYLGLDSSDEDEVVKGYASSREYLDIELTEVEDDEYMDTMKHLIKSGEAPDFGFYDFDPDDDETNSGYYFIRKGLTADEMDDIWNIISSAEKEDY